MANVLRIHPEDNVVVALADLAPGTTLELGESTLKPGVISGDPIPFGHKVAVVPIARGQAVIKYGAPIGVATEDIAPGQHVHVHNLRSVRGVIRP